MNEVENRHSWKIKVPCPECFAHTDELCREGLNYLMPNDVHREREAQARRAPGVHPHIMQ
jgi:hypothetical protein